jgi:hypothetical protein
LKDEPSVRLLDKVRFGALSSLGCTALLTALSTGGGDLSHARAATSPPAGGANPSQLFGVYPAQQGATTLPGGHFNYALLPGKTISDGIVVENFSDHALTFHVYGADLLTADGGGLAPAQRTAVMHAAGAWITVSTPTKIVPAHSQFTDDFTLTLPAVVSPGEHLGAVVAAADVGLTPQGTSVEARTALITVVTVPGTALPSGALSPLSGSAATAGQLGFGITLSNTGNVLLTYTGSLLINDGHEHRVVALPLTPSDAYVVPAGRVLLSAVWKDAAPTTDHYSAQATVTLLAGGTPVATLTSQSLALPTTSEFPIAIFVVLATAVMGLLATWLIRGRILRRRIRVASARNALAGRLRGQT